MTNDRAFRFAGEATVGVITTGSWGTLVTRQANHSFYGGGAGVSLAQTILPIADLTDPTPFLLPGESLKGQP